MDLTCFPHRPCYFSLNDRPICNYFLKGIVSEDACTAAHVTIKPTHKSQSLEWASLTYRLPDFHSALSLYLSHLGFQTLLPNLLNVWNAFQLQLLSRFHGFKVMPSQQLQALALSMEYPFGKCDMVLLYSSHQDGKLRILMTCSHSLNEFLLRGAYGGAGSHGFFFL